MVNLKKYLTDFELEQVANPEFDAPGKRVHDWRTYIPREIEGAWQSLSQESRIAAYLVAKAAADREDWG